MHWDTKVTNKNTDLVVIMVKTNQGVKELDGKFKLWITYVDVPLR